MDLINADCLEYLPKIKEGTVDLILLDLPYGQTSCKWDCEIDLQKMWKEIKRIIKPTGIILFFCTTKFGYKLIESNPRWFRYDLVWKKSRKVGFLSANKMPLRQHEMVYVFKPKQGTYNAQKTEGHKPYFYGGNKECNIYNDKPRLDCKSDGDKRHPTSIVGEFEETPHPSEVEGEFIPAYIEVEGCHEMVYVFKPKQGTYNPQKTAGHKPRDRSENKRGVVDTVYGEKIDISKGKNTTDERHPTSVIGEFEEEHEMVYVFKDKQGTYNPQKTPREKDYKHSGKRSSEEHYGDVLECKKVYKKEDGKHPSTILEFNNPHRTIHKTQKPVDLCEWLIKSYSNENEVVLDFCMGSGTVGEACRNTNRKFIGVEKDPEIFKIAKERLKKYKIFH